MIGLEVVLKVYGISSIELAKKLNINRANVSMWLSKKRKIPSERVEELSTIFNGIPTEYLQKELTKSEELEIQIIYLQQTDKFETIEVPVTDEEGNTVAWREEFYSAHAGVIDFLDNEQTNFLIMEKVKELVIDNEEAKRLIHDFLNIMERGRRKQIEFLTELLIYLNGKKETLFMEKYEDLEQYLKKHHVITDE